MALGMRVNAVTFREGGRWHGLPECVDVPIDKLARVAEGIGAHALAFFADDLGQTTARDTFPFPDRPRFRFDVLNGITHSEDSA